MTIEEFIEQERHIRSDVHYNDGVWWRRVSMGNCLPLYPMQEFQAKSSRPTLLKGFLRYRHLTPDEICSNTSVTYLMIPEEKLDSFSFENLSHSRRKAINQSAKFGLVVRKLQSLDSHWAALKQIYISQSKRTNYGIPESYYVHNEEDWRRNLGSEFSLQGRDWFGVFHENTIVAFMYSCVIGDIAHLLVTKLNSDYIKLRPSDALYYNVISYYRTQSECRRVCAGQANLMTPSINHIKLQYLFEPVEFPAYQWICSSARSLLRCVLPGASLAFRWQSADSKRNLRYKIEMMKKSVANW